MASGLLGMLGAGEAGSLFVNFTGENAQLLAKAQESEAAVQKSSAGMESSSAGAAAGISTAWAGAALAVVGFVTIGVKRLAELQKVEAQTEAVLRSTGNAAHVSAAYIQERAKALDDLTSIDRVQVQSAENLLLTFTAIRNEVGAGNNIFDQATEAVLNMSVALGEDANTAAIQLGKALQDPIRGVTALRRVGVALSQQQLELVKTLVESGHQLEAQKIILAELRREFGGSAEALGGTFAGRWQLFISDVQDSAAAIAEKLLPMLQEFIDDSRVVVDVISPLIGAIGKVNPLLVALGGYLLFVNRALIADLVTLRAMPVALATTEEAFWGVGAASEASALKVKGFGAVVVLAALAAVHGVQAMDKALSTSNKELSDSLDVSASRIAAIREQLSGHMNSGFIGLVDPIFHGRAAVALKQTSEAVDVYKKILDAATAAGLSDADIQDRLNKGWKDAVGALGGAGGNLDGFRDKLAASLGLVRKEIAGQDVWVLSTKKVTAAVKELTKEQKAALEVQAENDRNTRRAAAAYEEFFNRLHSAPRALGQFQSYLALTGQSAGDFRTSLQEALAGSRADLDAWQADQGAKLAEWRAQAEEQFNGVKQALQGFEGQSKVSAKEIIKAFEDQLKVMATYHDDFDTLVSRLHGRSQDLVVYLQSMGLQGAGIVHALATANKQEFGKIIGDWEDGKKGAHDLAGDIQTQLVGAINKLIVAIQGIPGWAMSIDTSKATGNLEAVYRKAGQEGFVFVRHSGGWIADGVGNDPAAGRTWPYAELRNDERLAVVKVDEYVVDEATAKRHAALLENLPRYHDGGWVGSEQAVKDAGAAFGRQAFGWDHVGRHVAGAVTAEFRRDPAHWAAPPPAGGHSFPGGGGVNHGWDGHGSPAALFYWAAVQSAWPGLRFGGMYNRRFIKGTHTWSQHAYGNAIDEMVPSLSYGDQVYAWVRARSAQFHLAHLLWRVPDHFNHIHADFWPQGFGVPYGDGGVGVFDRPTSLHMLVGERGRERVTVAPEGRLGSLAGEDVLDELKGLRADLRRLELRVNVRTSYDSREATAADERRRLLKS